MADLRLDRLDFLVTELVKARMSVLSGPALYRQALPFGLCVETKFSGSITLHQGTTFSGTLHLFAAPLPISWTLDGDKTFPVSEETFGNCDGCEQRCPPIGPIQIRVDRERFDLGPEDLGPITGLTARGSVTIRSEVTVTCYSCPQD